MKSKIEKKTCLCKICKNTIPGLDFSKNVSNSPTKLSFYSAQNIKTLIFCTNFLFLSVGLCRTHHVFCRTTPFFCRFLAFFCRTFVGHGVLQRLFTQRRFLTKNTRFWLFVLQKWSESYKSPTKKWGCPTKNQLILQKIYKLKHGYWHYIYNNKILILNKI